MKRIALAALIIFWDLLPAASLDLRGPYLTELSANRATVVVHVSEKATLTLEYWADDAPDQVTRKKAPEQDRAVFQIEGLEPERDYTYRILAAGGTGEAPGAETTRFGFRTPPMAPSSFRFIAYGDSRRSPLGENKRHRAITRHFATHKPGFIIHTGDLLSGGPGASSSMFGEDWTFNFFHPLRGVIEGIPFHLVVGNHDQDSDAAREGVRTAFPHLEKSSPRSFRFGDAHVVILHVAERMREFESQREWFRKELERGSDAAWRIVFLHVAPFTNGKYHDAAWTLDGRALFLEECLRGKVDLVMSAHDHSYQRFHPLRISEGDNHAVLFVVTALAGTNPYHASEDEYSAKIVNKTDHFCVGHVSADELELTAYDATGCPIDHTGLRKGEQSPSKMWRPTSRK